MVYALVYVVVSLSALFLCAHDGGEPSTWGGYAGAYHVVEWTVGGCVATPAQ